MTLHDQIMSLPLLLLFSLFPLYALADDTPPASRKIKVLRVSRTICYDSNHHIIQCPRSKVQVIIGIVIAVALVLVIIAIFLFDRRRKRRLAAAAAGETQDEELEGEAPPIQQPAMKEYRGYETV
ncbi:hypothetical protein C8J56DRAFT_927412 [Mycena floridula]|nr:hypothetical protein C8J56DRAFT_927412 [Mycena floridula]